MNEAGGCGDLVSQDSSGPGFKDVCLVEALRQLGCPVECIRDGPFTAMDGCEMLKPLGVGLQYLRHGAPLRPGKYIVLDHEKKHFFAVRHVEGLAVKLDAGVATHLPLSSLADISLDPMLYVFKLVHGHAVPSSFEALPYTLQGGALSVSNKYECPLQKCQCPGCDGNLVYHKEVDAFCYDLNGPFEVTHVQVCCGSRNCRSNYGYTYRWENGSKVNVLSMKDL